MYRDGVHVYILVVPSYLIYLGGAPYLVHLDGVHIFWWCDPTQYILAVYIYFGGTPYLVYFGGQVVL